MMTCAECGKIDTDPIDEKGKFCSYQCAGKSGTNKKYKECGIAFCDRDHHSRHLCEMHYERYKRHGSPLRRGPLGSLGPNRKKTSDELIRVLKEESDGVYAPQRRSFGPERAFLSRFGSWEKVLKAAGLKPYYKKFDETITKTCEQCGEEYKTTKRCAHQKYCCKKCKYRANNTNRTKRRERRERAEDSVLSDKKIDYSRILEDYSFRCSICGGSINMKINNTRTSITFDHKVPISKGGAHAEWNLQPAHRACNSAKSDTFDGQFTLKKEAGG